MAHRGPRPGRQRRTGGRRRARGPGAVGRHRPRGAGGRRPARRAPPGAGNPQHPVGEVGRRSRPLPTPRRSRRAPWRRPRLANGSTFRPSRRRGTGCPRRVPNCRRVLSALRDKYGVPRGIGVGEGRYARAKPQFRCGQKRLTCEECCQDASDIAHYRCSNSTNNVSV